MKEFKVKPLNSPFFSPVKWIVFWRLRAVSGVWKALKGTKDPEILMNS